MQTIQSISNSKGTPVILLPLTTIILITAFKDLYEDFKRHRSDNEENRKKVEIGLNSDFQEGYWKDIRVGSIIKIYENQYFPADFLLIQSSDPKGIFKKKYDAYLNYLGMCFIETKNLDGETNLKHKFVQKDLLNFYSNNFDVSLFFLEKNLIIDIFFSVFKNLHALNMKIQIHIYILLQEVMKLKLMKGKNKLV